MRRNLLAFVALLGTVAVGALFLLLRGGDGGHEAPRAGGAAVDAPVPPTRGPARPDEAPEGPVPRPSDRQAIEARERHGGDVVELVRRMIDPKATPQERLGSGRELRRLVRLMGEEVSPDVRKGLLALLAEAPAGQKQEVAGAIGLLRGDEGTAHALVQMLRDGSADLPTRKAICAALGMIDVSGSATGLLALLGQGHPDEPLLIRTIGELSAGEELRELYARLDETDAAASRAEIERVLRENAGTAFLDEVAAALPATADPRRRRSLLRILEGSSSPSHAARVRDLLQDETDQESRAIAIQALGRFGDPESGKALLDLMETGSPEDRRRASGAIRSIRDLETIGILAAGWPALPADARVAVMEVISRAESPTEPMTVTARDQGLYDAEPGVRIAAAKTLGRHGRDDAVGPLVAYLQRSRAYAEWIAAFGALEGIGTAEAASAALDALGLLPNERERARLEQRFRRILDEAK